MGAYILRRILLIFPTLFGIMVINFIVVQFAPGGPVEQIIAQASGQGQVSNSMVSSAGGPGAGNSRTADGDFLDPSEPRGIQPPKLAIELDTRTNFDEAFDFESVTIIPSFRCSRDKKFVEISDVGNNEVDCRSYDDELVMLYNSICTETACLCHELSAVCWISDSYDYPNLNPLTRFIQVYHHNASKLTASVSHQYDNTTKSPILKSCTFCPIPITFPTQEYPKGEYESSFFITAR